MFVMFQLVNVVYVSLDSLETSAKIVNVKMHVMLQRVNVAYASLDSLETSAKCVSVKTA